MPTRQFPSFDTSSGTPSCLLETSQPINTASQTPVAEVLRLVDTSFATIHDVLLRRDTPNKRKTLLVGTLQDINMQVVENIEDIVCSHITGEELVHISHAIYALFFGQIRAYSGLKTALQIGEIRLQVAKLLIPEITYENKHRQYLGFLDKYYRDKRNVWTEFGEYHGKKGRVAETILVSFLRRLGRQVPEGIKFQGTVEIEVTRGAIVFYISNEQDFAKIPGTVTNGLVCRGLYYGTSVSSQIGTGQVVLVKSKKGSQDALSIRKHELVHRDDVFLWNTRDKRFGVAHREILAFFAQGRLPQEVEAILCYENGFYFPSDAALKAAKMTKQEYKQAVQNFVKAASKIITLYPQLGIYLLAVTPILQWESILIM